MRSLPALGLCALLGLPALTSAQRVTVLPVNRQFVSVDTNVVALTNVKLIDGTATPARDAMTVIIEGRTIRAVGPTASTQPPANALVIDLAGHTVIPGLVGLHDHMYYNSRTQITSYPRLFLSAGVTTIRTTGSYDSYAELNLKRRIDRDSVVGPSVYVTGPYLQGPGAGPGSMHPLSGPDDARRMVKYWADEGVSWFKAYTQISRAELGAAIQEAHKNGIKVTAHLCSVGFREAVALGIDNLEHGLLVNTEYSSKKVPDQCPQVTDAEYAALDVNSAQVQQTFKEMVQKNVAMTSTLAVMETGMPSRVPFDQRVLDALFPEASAQVARYYEQGKTRAEADKPAIAALKKAMEYERAFVKAGGLLAAGSDPCCGPAIAGYADQRNFELLVEAGFTPEQVVQIMSANGAKVLGGADRFGTIKPGLNADLVVLRGNLASDASVIKNVVTVFRHGVGYDAAKLTAAVKGRIGIN
jgi:imidazolonepropionase-like amidohydrolase